MMSPLPLPLLPPTGEPLRVVLDTNVALAFWHYRHPRLLALLACIEARAAVLFTRADCLDELCRVLGLAAFGLEPTRQAALFGDYRARCQALDHPTGEARDAVRALPRCNDPEDQRFVELAWQADAHLLLTRDKQLLALDGRLPGRRHTRIVTPERLMKWLHAEAVSSSRRGIAVVNERASAHDLGVHELEITGKGLRVLGPA